MMRAVLAFAKSAQATRAFQRNTGLGSMHRFGRDRITAVEARVFGAGVPFFVEKASADATQVDTRGNILCCFFD